MGKKHRLRKFPKSTPNQRKQKEKDIDMVWLDIHFSPFEGKKYSESNTRKTMFIAKNIYLEFTRDT